MLYFVIGLPGRFTEWCDTATAAIARRALGSTELFRADTLEEISLAMIRSGAARAVVASRQPGGRLRAALVEAGRTFVVVIEDPRIALAEAVQAGKDLASAVQLVANSCAGIARIAPSPGALALFRDCVANDPIGVLQAIADHLSLSLGDTELIEIVDSLAAAGLKAPERDEPFKWVGVEENEKRIVGGALDPFIEYLSTGELRSIVWERELFFLGDRPNERADGLVDITGRARCLLHGPYIMLPPGPWSLSLSLLFSSGTVDHDFVIEVVGDQHVASCTIRPQTEGVHEANLRFTLEPTTDHPTAIRLSSQRAAFDGTVALLRANLIPDETAVPDRLPAVAVPG